MKFQHISASEWKNKKTVIKTRYKPTGHRWNPQNKENILQTDSYISFVSLIHSSQTDRLLKNIVCEVFCIVHFCLRIAKLIYLFSATDDETYCTVLAINRKTDIPFKQFQNKIQQNNSKNVFLIFCKIDNSFPVELPSAQVHHSFFFHFYHRFWWA